MVARQEDYSQRFKVERSFAWLDAYRRLLIRWEHLFAVYRGLFTVALMALCVRRLIPRHAPAPGILDVPRDRRLDRAKA